MQLRDYLKKERMEIQEFAKIINYSRVHLGSIINGRLKPGKKMALVIEKETKGLVSAKELLNYSSEKAQQNTNCDDNISNNNANII